MIAKQAWTLRCHVLGILIVAFGWAVSAAYGTYPGLADPQFKAGGGADDEVLAMCRQSDGKVLIGGRFLMVDGAQRNRIARLHQDGSLDRSFDPGQGADGAVRAIVCQPDGRILVGGEFLNCGGILRPRLARLHSNGSLDTSFTPGNGASGPVRAMALQANGRILIGGAFATYQGTPRNNIARVLEGGGLDTEFSPGTGTNGEVNALLVTADDKILLGGAFTLYAGVARGRIARVNENGSLDTGFAHAPNTGADDVIHAIAYQPFVDGVLVGGDFTHFNGVARNRLAKLTFSGQPDIGFTAVGEVAGSVKDVVYEIDGRIMAVGDFTSVNSFPRQRVVRVKDSGEMDVLFDTRDGANSVVNKMLLQPDGKVLIAGAFTSYQGKPSGRIARVQGQLEFKRQTFSGFCFGLEGGMDLTGGLTLSLARGGQFSAVYRHQGRRYRFRSAFNSEGECLTSLTLREGALITCQLSLRRSPQGGDTLAGVFLSTTSLASVGADAPYFGTRQLRATAYAGYYTGYVGLDPGPEPLVPKGVGVMGLRVNLNGRGRLAGRLADDTPFVGSGFVAASGRWILYVPLYRQQGYLAGLFSINPAAPISPFSGDVLWKKPADPKARSYPEGFRLMPAVTGTRYEMPVGLPPDLLEPPDNARITALFGNLPAPLGTVFSLDARGRVTITGGELDALALKFNRRTGMVTGQWRPPGHSRRVPLRAVRYEAAKEWYGYTLIPGAETRASAIIVDDH